MNGSVKRLLPPNWLWVKTLNSGEHQNRWRMDVHPPEYGAIGYAPWPTQLVALGFERVVRGSSEGTPFGP